MMFVFRLFYGEMYVYQLISKQFIDVMFFINILCVFQYWRFELILYR